ncbi:MAG: transcriptional repressor [bacterium]
MKAQRNTKQRQVILQQLRQLTTHPTARELYEIVRLQLPRISLGTIYRNLDLLHKKGEIQKLALGAREARYDGNPDRHQHVRCTECGRICDFIQRPKSVADMELDDADGWKIVGQRTEFIGICPECRQQGQPE